MKERALRHGAVVQHLHNSPSLQSPAVNQKFLIATQTTATVEFINPLYLVVLRISIPNKSILKGDTPYGTVGCGLCAPSCYCLWSPHTCYILFTELRAYFALSMMRSNLILAWSWRVYLVLKNWIQVSSNAVFWMQKTGFTNNVSRCCQRSSTATNQTLVVAGYQY